MHATSPMFDDTRYRINCLVFVKITRPSCTASTIVEKLSSSSIICDASFATDVPEPIAIPMSARFNAVASFTPSPVIATTSPLRFYISTIYYLCRGSTRQKSLPTLTARLYVSASNVSKSVPVNTSSELPPAPSAASVPFPNHLAVCVFVEFGYNPSDLHIDCAVTALSPVITTTRIPARFARCSASFTPCRTGSSIPTIPTKISSCSIVSISSLFTSPPSPSPLMLFKLLLLHTFWYIEN
uniref:Uncharacterized protein n=1 Tax=Lygus hesperus TaxID=30085 RepID=A0A0A9XZH5_LYGHE